MRVNPDITCNLLTRRSWESLDVLLFPQLILLLRVWKGGLEHARRADEAVARSSLDSPLQSATPFELSSSRRRVAHTYHQEVRLGPFAIGSSCKDTASGEVFGEWHAQMRVIQYTQVLRLGRIGRADLTDLDFQLRLSQASSLDQSLV